MTLEARISFASCVVEVLEKLSGQELYYKSHHRSETSFKPIAARDSDLVGHILHVRLAQEAAAVRACVLNTIGRTQPQSTSNAEAVHCPSDLLS